jgi:hypothetical protein
MAEIFILGSACGFPIPGLGHSSLLLSLLDRSVLIDAGSQPHAIVSKLSRFACLFSMREIKAYYPAPSKFQSFAAKDRVTGGPERRSPSGIQGARNRQFRHSLPLDAVFGF